MAKKNKLPRSAALASLLSRFAEISNPGCAGLLKGGANRAVLSLRNARRLRIGGRLRTGGHLHTTRRLRAAPGFLNQLYIGCLFRRYAHCRNLRLKGYTANLQSVTVGLQVFLIVAAGAICLRSAEQ